MCSLLDQVSGEWFLFLINWRFSDDNQKNAAHFGRRVKHYLKYIFVTGKEKADLSFSKKSA